MDQNLSSLPASPSHPTTAHPLRRFILIIAITLGLGFLTSIPIYLYFARPYQLITPLAQTAQLLGLNFPLPKPNKIVYGFIPYWNFKYQADIPFQYLTHLGIFGIAFNEDGTIQTREADYTEPGYRSFQLEPFSQLTRRAQATNTRTDLVLRGFDNDTTDSIITSPTHTQTLISETVSFMQQHHFSGINLDFEYLNEPDSTTIDNFTSFVASVSAGIKSHFPQAHISIDVFADSASQTRIWDLSAIHPHVDHIIIMTYDFHRPSSTVAGPVAPLYGAPDYWNEDITSLLAEHLKKIPSHKILLGVPYYGYEWQTTTTEYQSQTYPRTGGIATLKRIQDLTTESTTTNINWHPFALSPWLYYQKDEDVFQIYYENSHSLSLKYDLVNQSDLAGIAIWALGYEPPDSPIWSLIPEKFSSQ